MDGILRRGILPRGARQSWGSPPEPPGSLQRHSQPRESGRAALDGSSSPRDEPEPTQSGEPRVGGGRQEAPTAPEPGPELGFGGFGGAPELFRLGKTRGLMEPHCDHEVLEEEE